MKEIKIFINEQGVAKGRPRFRVLGNKRVGGRLIPIISTYTPAKTKKFEKLIAQEYEDQAKKYKFKDSPLAVTIKFIFEPCKSTSKKRRAELIRQKWHTQKPDLDNLTKSILDALNDIAYADDNEIAKLSLEKIWGDDNGIEITIKELDNGQ